MKKHPKIHSPAKSGAPTTGTWRVIRQFETGIYYDRDSGRIGFGNTYGEHSFNQRPIHAEPVKSTSKTIAPKIPQNGAKISTAD